MHLSEYCKLTEITTHMDAWMAWGRVKGPEWFDLTQITTQVDICNSWHIVRWSKLGGMKVICTEMMLGCCEVGCSD